MQNMGQYTKWVDQEVGNIKLTGGYGDTYDVNVGAVYPPDVLVFTVSDSKQPTISMRKLPDKEIWLLNGRVFTPTFPMQFTLRDASTLTIDRNSPEPGDLIYTQV